MNEEILEKEEQTANEKFNAYLLDKGITYTSVATKLGISIGHLHAMLKYGRPMGENTRKKLNEYLQTDF